MSTHNLGFGHTLESRRKVNHLIFRPGTDLDRALVWQAPRENTEIDFYNVGGNKNVQEE